MKVYHATTRKNLPTILANGLLARLAKGRRKATWLASRHQAAWAVLHVCGRHRVTPDQVVLLECEVQRKALRRFSTRGLWYTGDVPPAQVRVCGSYQFVSM